MRLFSAGGFRRRVFGPALDFLGRFFRPRRAGGACWLRKSSGGFSGARGSGQKYGPKIGQKRQKPEISSAGQNVKNRPKTRKNSKPVKSAYEVCTEMPFLCNWEEFQKPEKTRKIYTFTSPPSTLLPRPPNLHLLVYPSHPSRTSDLFSRSLLLPAKGDQK